MYIIAVASIVFAFVCLTCPSDSRRKDVLAKGARCVRYAMTSFIFRYHSSLHVSNSSNGEAFLFVERPPLLTSFIG